MSVLSDREIKRLLFDATVPLAERIRVLVGDDPIPVDRVRPASIDLTVSNEFRKLSHRKWLLFRRVFDLARIEREEIEKWHSRVIYATRERGITIYPGELVLALTAERIKLPDNIMGFVVGRNSYARLGLQVTTVANMKTPGHDGCITLQIKNAAPFPIRLYPGIRLCQLVLIKMNGPCEKADRLGRYGHENQVGWSKFWDDDEIRELRTIDRKRQIDWKGWLNLLTVVSSILAVYQIVAQPGSKGVIFSVAITIALIVIQIIVYFIERNG